jgi:hypothetical protein
MGAVPDETEDLSVCWQRCACQVGSQRHVSSPLVCHHRQSQRGLEITSDAGDQIRFRTIGQEVAKRSQKAIATDWIYAFRFALSMDETLNQRG